MNNGALREHFEKLFENELGQLQKDGFPSQIIEKLRAQKDATLDKACQCGSSKGRFHAVIPLGAYHDTHTKEQVKKLSKVISPLSNPAFMILANMFENSSDTEPYFTFVGEEDY